MKQNFGMYQHDSTDETRVGRSTPANTLIISGSFLIALWCCLLLSGGSRSRRSTPAVSQRVAEKRAAGNKDDPSPTWSNNAVVAAATDMEIGYGPLPGLTSVVYYRGNGPVMYHWHLCPVVDREGSQFPRRKSKPKFLTRYEAESRNLAPCLYCSRLVLDHH